MYQDRRLGTRSEKRSGPTSEQTEISNRQTRDSTKQMNPPLLPLLSPPHISPPGSAAAPPNQSHLSIWMDLFHATSPCSRAFPNWAKDSNFSMASMEMMDATAASTTQPRSRQQNGYRLRHANEKPRHDEYKEPTISPVQRGENKNYQQSVQKFQPYRLLRTTPPPPHVNRFVTTVDHVSINAPCQIELLCQVHWKYPAVEHWNSPASSQETAFSTTFFFVLQLVCSPSTERSDRWRLREGQQCTIRGRGDSEWRRYWEIPRAAKDTRTRLGTRLASYASKNVNQYVVFAKRRPRPRRISER